MYAAYSWAYLFIICPHETHTEFEYNTAPRDIDWVIITNKIKNASNSINFFPGTATYLKTECGISTPNMTEPRCVGLQINEPWLMTGTPRPWKSLAEKHISTSILWTTLKLAVEVFGEILFSSSMRFLSCLIGSPTFWTSPWRLITSSRTILFTRTSDFTTSSHRTCFRIGTTRGNSLTRPGSRAENVSCIARWESAGPAQLW